MASDITVYTTTANDQTTVASALQALMNASSINASGVSFCAIAAFGNNSFLIAIGKH